jgi:hypothetical protein
LAEEALPAKESVEESVKEFVQYLRLRREAEAHAAGAEGGWLAAWR